MKLMQYREWAETAQLVQLLCQMLGKVKLEKMPRQPEWNHSLLYITHSGFTTGLIPDRDGGFAIELDIAAGTVAARCTNGLAAGFRLRQGGAVSEYYASFGKMLQHIGHPVNINPVPQECFTTTPFGHQHEPRGYDVQSALVWFENCVLAYNGLLAFAAPYRGKKILPCLFWGTFDMTCILFSGEPKPYGGKGLIPRVAFDEQLVEFGFWPGDAATDAPSFFALPYPFATQPLPDGGVRPAAAFFSAEKKEYFLPLQAELAQPDPAAAIQNFCTDAFSEITKAEGWQNLEWLAKPLV